jgi:RimJ/RimL family protein N-acetyltransferase
MPRPVPVLEGRIVTLRPLDPERDAPDYYEMNLDPEMHLWTNNHVLGSPEEARRELERYAAMDDVTMWAIIDNASGRLVGRFFVCLEDRGGVRVAGEGNRIAKPFWRRGHNREARRLVFEYVFGALGADHVETECWAENVNSRESLKAHGFTLVQEAPHFNHKHQKMIQKLLFRLSREQWREWAAAQAGAGERLV